MPDRYDRTLHALVTRADLELMAARRLEPLTRLAYLVTSEPAT